MQVFCPFFCSLSAALQVSIFNFLISSVYQTNLGILCTHSSSPTQKSYVGSVQQNRESAAESLTKESHATAGLISQRCLPQI